MLQNLDSAAPLFNGSRQPPALRSATEINVNVYQAVQAVLETALDGELELDDYLVNLRRMFGEEVMDAVVGSVNGTLRFYGHMQLEG